MDEDKIEEVCEVLGISRGDVVDIQWADNGPGWIGVLLESANAVLNLEPAGSLNAPIAHWLIGGWRAKPPYVARQGTCLGREGRISVFEEDGEIWIGGSVISLVLGTFSFAKGDHVQSC